MLKPFEVQHTNTNAPVPNHPPTEIEKFLADTEEYMQKLSRRLAGHKAKDDAKEAYERGRAEARLRVRGGGRLFLL